MSLTPSGNERLDTPGQPSVEVNRWVRTPADYLAEAAVPWLLASAPFQVREALSFQVHVHVVDAGSGPAMGRGHVREPSREHFPVQVVVKGTHLPYRAVNTAPVDGIRRKEVRNPMQVHMGSHSPGGGLVLVFLHQDLGLRRFGQVRFVVGELVVGSRAVVSRACLLSLNRSSPGANP